MEADVGGGSAESPQVVERGLVFGVSDVQLLVDES